jgi:hypothetical protein
MTKVKKYIVERWKIHTELVMKNVLLQSSALGKYAWEFMYEMPILC